jgi:RNA polymerase sigma-70 factor (ECF subfamily)
MGESDNRDTQKERFCVELTETHYLRMCRFIHNGLLLHGLQGNLEDVQDIAQEVFLQAWRSIDTLLAHPNVSGWLAETAKNRILRFKQTVVSQRENLTTLESAESLAVPENSELEILDCLTENERQLFEMYYIQGLNHAEIAQTLGIKESASQKRLSRIRAKLRKSSPYSVVHKKFTNIFKKGCQLWAFFGAI